MNVFQSWQYDNICKFENKIWIRLPEICNYSIYCLFRFTLSCHNNLVNIFLMGTVHEKIYQSMPLKELPNWAMYYDICQCFLQFLDRLNISEDERVGTPQSSPKQTKSCYLELYFIPPLLITALIVRKSRQKPPSCSSLARRKFLRKSECMEII